MVEADAGATKGRFVSPRARMFRELARMARQGYPVPLDLGIELVRAFEVGRRVRNGENFEAYAERLIEEIAALEELLERADAAPTQSALWKKFAAAGSITRLAACTGLRQTELAKLLLAEISAAKPHDIETAGGDR